MAYTPATAPMVISSQVGNPPMNTLVCSKFLGKTAVGVRLFIIDEHNIHRAVANIAEHIYT